MRILLTKLATGGQVQVDGDMMDDYDMDVASAHEAKAFQRTVEDVRFQISDVDGKYSAFFRNAIATDRFRLEVFDGAKTIFRGEVKNRTLQFPAKSMKAQFDAFSDLKTFFDRAKQHLINAAPSAPELLLHYTTVEYILTREFVLPSVVTTNGINPTFSDLLSRIIVADDYKSRPIRGWANAATYSDPTIGDNGRYLELSKSPYTSKYFASVISGKPQPDFDASSGPTTGFDLLTAFMIYYNAEFYIDYDQNALVMGHRNVPRDRAPAAGLPFNFDDVLLDDPEPTSQLIDDEKFDYVKVPYYFGPPTKPTFVSFSQLSKPGLNKNVSYVMTEILRFNNIDMDIETPPSYRLDVDVQSFIASLGIIGGQKYAGVRINLPAVKDAHAIKRRIYRTKQGGGDFYMLTEITSDPTVPIVLTDQALDTSLNVGILPPVKSASMSAWIRFDEASQKWLDPIVDNANGANTPQGNVLSLIPSLSFREIGSDTFKQPSVADIVAFFGLEAGGSDYNSKIQTDYKELFLTKYMVSCGVEGTGYKIGDLGTLTVVPIPFPLSQVMIKRARIYCSPRQQKSELELLAV